MSKFLANVFLFIAAYATMLGNFWYTYGIWPKSWLAFVLFSGTGILLITFRLQVDRESK